VYNRDSQALDPNSFVGLKPIQVLGVQLGAFLHFLHSRREIHMIAQPQDIRKLSESELNAR
jgi:hypothetical protein